MNYLQRAELRRYAERMSEWERDSAKCPYRPFRVSVRAYQEAFMRFHNDPVFRSDGSRRRPR